MRTFVTILSLLAISYSTLAQADVFKSPECFEKLTSSAKVSRAVCWKGNESVKMTYSQISVTPEQERTCLNVPSNYGKLTFGEIILHKNVPKNELQEDMAVLGLNGKNGVWPIGDISDVSLSGYDCGGCGYTTTVNANVNGKSLKIDLFSLGGSIQIDNGAKLKFDGCEVFYK